MIKIKEPSKKGENFLKNRSDIKLIEKDIIAGISLRQLGLKYNCSDSSLSRYKNKYMVQKCSVSQTERNLREGEELLNLLQSHIGNVVKLSNACLAQLQDPDDPEKLFLGARGTEITVSYMQTTASGTQIKAKQNLQVMIDRLINRMDTGTVITKIEINTTDRAHTLIAAANALNKHIRLFGDLCGQLGNTTINITNQPLFVAFTKEVISLLAQYPGAREKLAESMRLSLPDAEGKEDNNE